MTQGPFSDEEPDADWTDDYPWTRYRGPKAYPIPEDWVLNVAEADGVLFRQYPDIGKEHETDNDVADSFAPDYDGPNEARGIDASVGIDHIDDEEVQTMTVNGKTIFQRVEPTAEDLWATVAAVLEGVSQGEEYQDITPETGKPPAKIRKQQTVKRRKENNQQLNQFN